MTRSPLLRPTATIVIAGLAGISVTPHLHLGLARLFILLLFLSLAPGAALLNLLLPEFADFPTTLVLCIGTSIAFDVAVSQIALAAHAWNPIRLVAFLSVVTICLSMMRVVRVVVVTRIAGGADSTAELARPRLRPKRSPGQRTAPHAITEELYATLIVLGLVLMVAAAGQSSLSRTLAGAVGAAIAGAACAGCVVIVLRSQYSRSSGRQATAFWAAAMLATLLVVIVTVRFFVFG